MLCFWRVLSRPSSASLALACVPRRSWWLSTWTRIRCSWTRISNPALLPCESLALELQTILCLLILFDVPKSLVPKLAVTRTWQPGHFVRAAQQACLCCFLHASCTSDQAPRCCHGQMRLDGQELCTPVPEHRAWSQAHMQVLATSLMPRPARNLLHRYPDPDAPPATALETVVWRRVSGALYLPNGKLPKLVQVGNCHVCRWVGECPTARPSQMVQVGESCGSSACLPTCLPTCVWEGPPGEKAQ